MTTSSFGSLKLPIYPSHLQSSWDKARKDITGHRYGSLLVQKFHSTNGSKGSMWECLCDCGKTHIARGTALRSGHTKSCGCLRAIPKSDPLNHAKPMDITDKRFGMLTAIKENGRGNNGKIMWLCKCECGSEKTVRGTDLRNGNTKSCGCTKMAGAKAHREKSMRAG